MSFSEEENWMAKIGSITILLCIIFCLFVLCLYKLYLKNFDNSDIQQQLECHEEAWIRFECNHGGRGFLSLPDWAKINRYGCYGVYEQREICKNVHGK